MGVTVLHFSPSYRYWVTPDMPGSTGYKSPIEGLVGKTKAIFTQVALATFTPCLLKTKGRLAPPVITFRGNV
jgi:hypothetical protein